MKIPILSPLISLALLQLMLIDMALADSAEVNQTIDRSDPVTMVRQTTEEALQLAQEARNYAADNRERYYRQIESIVDQVVNVPYFARGVMGVYASARHYQALESEQEREKFRARVIEFPQVLKRSFIETYADALLSYEGERIELESPPEIDDNMDEVTLIQKIHSGPDVYTVQYRLHKEEDGNWLVANVIAEGFNIGLVYRNQFAAAVERHGGDVDYVVNNWRKIMEGVAESANAKSGAPQ